MEGSERTTTRINHLSSSTKTSKKKKKQKKKKIQPYDGKFFAKQYIKSL